MNNPKHTPGPWILETVPTSGGSGLCHKIGKFPNDPWRDEPTAACIYGDGLRIGIDDTTPRAIELLANARLIAVGPEMYSLLSEIARGPYPDSDYRSLCETYAKQAQALLAKADWEAGA